MSGHAVSSIFRFALLKTLRGKMTKNLFELVSALRSPNAFPYALPLNVDLTEERSVVFIQTN